MPITDWPVEQRPREKLLQKGPETLSDAELLAIFLRTGTQGISAVDLAQQLISRFGGLRPILLSGQQTFCEANGLGPAKYSQLQAVLEMAKRHLAEELDRRQCLTSTAQTKQFLLAQLRDQPREVFACIFLDNQHRVIKYEALFFGTIHSATVHPREIVRRALHHNAAAIIFAHNHPSGVAEPSRADQQLTQSLVEALNIIDVRVLDHLVVGDGYVESFAEKGWL